MYFLRCTSMIILLLSVKVVLKRYWLLDISILIFYIQGLILFVILRLCTISECLAISCTSWNPRHLFLSRN